MESAKVLAVAVIVIGILCLGPYLAIRNFNECRDHGFSFLYCITRK